MAHASHRPNSLVVLVSSFWHRWRTTCDRTVSDYYIQCIEANPEKEAQRYWSRLQYPQSGINVREISDAMLSRLMNSMLEQGISKFAVDCFILELRRLKRLHSLSTQ